MGISLIPLTSAVIGAMATKTLMGAVGFVMGSGVEISFSPESRFLFSLGFAFSALLVVISSLTAVVLRRITRWSYPDCLLAAAPAGMVEMTLLAQQLGLDPFPIFVLHFSRTVSVIVVAPILYALTFN